MVAQTASPEECAGRAGLWNHPDGARVQRRGGIATTPPQRQALDHRARCLTHHSCALAMGTKPADRHTRDTSGLRDRTNETVGRNPR
jgi:hypothetical protein